MTPAKFFALLTKLTRSCTEDKKPNLRCGEHQELSEFYENHIILQQRSASNMAYTLRNAEELLAAFGIDEALSLQQAINTLWVNYKTASLVRYALFKEYPYEGPYNPIPDEIARRLIIKFNYIKETLANLLETNYAMYMFVTSGNIAERVSRYLKGLKSSVDPDTKTVAYNDLPKPQALTHSEMSGDELGLLGQALAAGSNDDASFGSDTDSSVTSDPSTDPEDYCEPPGPPQCTPPTDRYDYRKSHWSEELTATDNNDERLIITKDGNAKWVTNLEEYFQRRGKEQQKSAQR